MTNHYPRDRWAMVRSQTMRILEQPVYKLRAHTHNKHADREQRADS